jgi:hypothetical protein
VGQEFFLDDDDIITAPNSIYVVSVSCVVTGQIKACLLGMLVVSVL